MKVNATISRVYRQWSLRFWLRNLILLGLTLGVVYPWFDAFAVAVLCALALFGVMFFFLKDKPSLNQVVLMLNAQLPELEFSVNLAGKEGLSGLAALQQQKIEKRLANAAESIKYPVNWSISAVWVIAVGLSFLLSELPGSDGQKPIDETQLVQQSIDADQKEELLTVSLEALQPKVQPPDYTGIKSFVSGEDIRMPEGSQVSWSVKFSGLPKYAYLHFSNGDSLSLRQEQAIRTIRKSSVEQGFYWISYFDGRTAQRTPYYKIELIADEPPVVTIDGIAQYQKLPYRADASLTFTAKALDDYGLREAKIVATVTKGDGESVKFREERLSFSAPVTGKSFTESMNLKASDFGMEPGNELYFYLEAKDNKTPESQSNRTETYFFVLEDTTNVEFSLVGSLGVDLMPEYFRSQRQIIIDTEKLLAEKDDIPITEFKSRSNELGFDQKTLRLKYGQFLGEEAESGIAIENEVEPEEDHDHEGHDHKPGEDVLAEFGHDHDHEDEAGQLMDKGTEQKTEAEKAIEDIAHSHDDAETATFYEVSLKTKLRTALSEMWDAELYLRLFEPKKSLPYQYAALKLLKEIKNHARIYVQRIGFDPPPISEDGKRLTGKLEEVAGQKFDATPEDSLTFPAIRRAIVVLGPVNESKDTVANSFQVVLQQAGNELAAEAIRFPSKYLDELGAISRLIKKDTFDQADLLVLTQLKKVFLSLLDQQEIAPVPVRSSTHPMTERVREKLSNESSRR